MCWFYSCGSQPGVPGPLGVLDKTRETVGLLVKCTSEGTSGVLLAEQNSVGGRVTEKGWEPLLYRMDLL